MIAKSRWMIEWKLFIPCFASLAEACVTECFLRPTNGLQVAVVGWPLSTVKWKVRAKSRRDEAGSSVRNES